MQAIHADQTLADLAVSHAGASRVFHRHGLDFCCGGQTSLANACEAAGLPADELVGELQAECRNEPQGEVAPAEMPLGELVDHILERYHASHREEVPRLIAMARKVESVHGEKDACPTGLYKHLEHMQFELEQHMMKEEEILFPMIQAGQGAMAAMPIQVMEHEHRDHGKNLDRLKELAHHFAAPPEACGTWRALYLGLDELVQAIMEHIHLENNILFPRSLRS